MIKIFMLITVNLFKFPTIFQWIIILIHSNKVTVNNSDSFLKQRRRVTSHLCMCGPPRFSWTRHCSYIRRSRVCSGTQRYSNTPVDAKKCMKNEKNVWKCMKRMKMKNVWKCMKCMKMKNVWKWKMYENEKCMKMKNVWKWKMYEHACGCEKMYEKWKNVWKWKMYENVWNVWK